MNSKNETSAGGIVYRKSDNGLEILVAKHSGYHKWVLPKGLVEPGEKLEETAVREVEEETGIVARIVAKLDEPEEYVYTFAGQRIFKKVYYFVMEYVSGDHDKHDFEMEEVMWAPFDEAVSLMGYDGAKKVLEKARKIIEKE